MGELIGKTAVVTGGTSGIGLGVAQALGTAGARVVVNGFGTDDQIAAALKSISPDATHADADLRNPEAIATMFAGIGTVDILVNNAGIQHVARVEDFTSEKWDAVIAVNLSAAFHTTAAVLPGMQKNGWGRIINIASAHGLVGSPLKSAYVAAKHGINGLTKVTALENAEADITCNAICPGWVLTPLVQAQIDARAAENGQTNEQATKALLSEKQPSLRFTTPEDIAGAVTFLLSGSAGNMTGTTLTLDGGWTAQ